MKEETQKSGQLEMFWRSFLDFERERTFFSIASTQAEKQKSKRCKIFFFGWMLHSSTSLLSGWSPFCQLRKDKMSQPTAQKLKKTNQTTLQPSRECKGVKERSSVQAEAFSSLCTVFQSHLDRPKLCL